MRLIGITDEFRHNVEIQEERHSGVRSAFFEKKRNLLVGMMGEEIFQWFYPSALRINTYDYDFILNNKRIDVKTKIFNKAPKDDYEVTFHLKKIPENDYFVLCGVNSDMTEGSLIGFISNREFFDLAKENRLGDIRPNDGKPYYASGYSIKISDFRRF